MTTSDTVPTTWAGGSGDPEEPPAPPPPVPAPPRRWRAAAHRLKRVGPASLVNRLVSGVVVLVVLLVLAIGTSTFLLLRSFVYAQLDSQVSPMAGRAEAVLDNCLPAASAGRQCELQSRDAGPTSNRLPSPQAEWISLVDSDGQTYLRSVQTPYGDLEAIALTPAEARTVIAANGPVTVTDRHGNRVRVAAAPIGQTGFISVAGLSTRSVDSTLARLLLVETSIGAAAVALALIASLTGVSFGLRGLRRVTHTAQEVTAELSPSGAGLERRVPLDTSTATEVNQLASSVNTLLGAVETQFAARVRSEERMREFLADASHELRTPLTSIRGFAELSRLQRRQTALEAGLDPAAADDDALDRIESEGTRMSRLVDDLLLLARSDHGAPPSRERVEIAPLVDDVLDSARVAHPDRPIESDVPPGIAVLGDRDQLLRVLRNLVTNAAVHTAPGGPILVSAFLDREEVVVQVADSGPGLEPDQAAHVFERFWRADKARTRARGGSGLGMSIVATIVEQHQGAVRFDSSPETGSTVTVSLPAAPPTD